MPLLLLQIDRMPLCPAEFGERLLRGPDVRNRESRAHSFHALPTRAVAHRTAATDTVHSVRHWPTTCPFAQIRSRRPALCQAWGHPGVGGYLPPSGAVIA